MRLHPSGMARVVQCPGSVKMSQGVPNPGGSAADEGTQAHAVAWAIALNRPIPEYATKEMIEGGHLYADTVGNVGHFEEYIKCPTLHPDLGGTPDHWVLDSGVLYVNDYKFGYSPVEVFKNWQLMTYAFGAFAAMGGQTEEVVFRIIQPRGFHRDGPVREWRTKTEALAPYFVRMKAAIESALADNAPTYFGPECRYCPARHICPSLQKASYQACDLAGESLPLELTPTAIGVELDLLQSSAKALEHRITGLSQQAESLLKSGQRIPGYSLQPKPGRERWTRPAEEIIALGQMMGVDVADIGAITPKQAIKAGLDAALVKSYSETPKGALTLVRDDTKLSSIFGSAP